MQIDKTYTLPFSTDAVYAAWISSNTVIAPATAMDILAEVGGYYRLVMQTPEFLGGNDGLFLRVEPGSRLTYTWEWNHDGEVSEIDVVFTPTAQGTLVAICHSGFTKEESVRSHDSGWDNYIEGFIAHMSAA